jgi:2-oxoglutarate dehydrogenase E2 component (dihydrolipoamide succinyltransferase)
MASEVEIRAPAQQTEGTRSQILRWLKSVGDTVCENEPLIEIETDKVTVEVASPGSGTLRQIVKQEQDEIGPGELLGRIEANGTANTALPVATSSAGSAAGITAARATTSASGTAPDSGGAAVSRGAAVSGTTPGAAAAPSSGARALSPAVRRLLAERGLDASEVRGTGQGGRITVEDVLTQGAGPEASCGDEGGTRVDIARADGARADGARADAAPADVARIDAGRTDGIRGHATRAGAARVDATRAADSRADSTRADAAAGQDYATDADAIAATEAAAVSTTAAVPSHRMPHTAIRKRIAEHMVQSLLHTAPHVTTVFEADLTAVLEHRTKNKDDFARRGAPLTLTAYFLQATVAAIRAVPEANSRWTDSALEVFDSIHIGVATALDTGLVVPVLRDVQSRDLFETARGLEDLVSRAREGRLSPADVRGGTFTISNHGVSGSIVATPIIINQPQSAILGVGKLEKRPVVVSENGADRIVIRPRCYVTLTIDHRVMDGHQANRFLQAFVERLATSHL